MLPVACCLLLLLVSLASGGISENDEFNIQPLSGLARHLMIRPVASPPDQVKVTIGLELLDVEVNEADNKVTLGGWLMSEWIDYRLAWSGGTAKHTRVSPANIWTPDLSVYNRVPVTADWMLNMPAIVEPSGKVIYIPPVSFTVRCQRSQTDEQDRITCPFKLGSWTHSAEEMDLVPRNSTLELGSGEFFNNGRWVVESSSLVRKEKQYDCCPEAYVFLEGEVVLKPQRS